MSGTDGTARHQRPQVALITGASSGIGLATARLLAGRGARLVLVGRSTSRLHAAAGRLDARLAEADLSRPEAVEQLARSVVAEEGMLDLLIHSAGQFELGPAERLTPEAAERLIRVNLLGVMSLTQALLPLLRHGHRPAVICVSSLAGRVSPPYMGVYAASKAALNAYAHALRQELRREGIHVGLVLPGPVDTPMVEGRLGGPYYPLPPGLPVLSAEQVARAVVRVAERRIPEVVLPRWLTAAARLGSAFPGLVDLLYRGLAR